MNSVENILIPGRHQLLTNYQAEYLGDLLETRQATGLDGSIVRIEADPTIIFAITSANHGNTKRNPIPGDRRAEAIALFGADIGATCLPYQINDVGPNDRFADFVVKEINTKRPHRDPISPENTAVICSTPEVIPMYQKLGYIILGAELDMPEGDRYRPWNCVEDIAEAGPSWRQSRSYLTRVHPASQWVLRNYDMGDRIVEVFEDPLLDSEGDITDTRDYETYEKAFKEGAERKYAIVRKYMRPGRIADIGCAGGDVIGQMTRDVKLSESDFFGFEASRELFEICERRRASNYFENDHVFPYQGNFMSTKVFKDNTINTTTTFSLTHEVMSYQGEDKLNALIQQIYDQTAPSGRFINLDVVGPENKDQEVLMKLADLDGKTETEEEIKAKPILSAEELDGLSTLGRFRRFAHDFRAGKKEPGWSEEVDIDGETYIRLSLADASDFLYTKDYTKSWYSEMKETFSYWSFSDWKTAVEKAGFTVNPDSHTFRNEWIVQNRLQGRAELYSVRGDTLEPLEYPVTTMLLVAEKGDS